MKTYKDFCINLKNIIFENNRNTELYGIARQLYGLSQREKEGTLKPTEKGEKEELIERLARIQGLNKKMSQIELEEYIQKILRDYKSSSLEFKNLEKNVNNMRSGKSVIDHKKENIYKNLQNQANNMRSS